MLVETRVEPLHEIEAHPIIDDGMSESRHKRWLVGRNVSIVDDNGVYVFAPSNCAETAPQVPSFASSERHTNLTVERLHVLAVIPNDGGWLRERRK
jgi:hypothetical protein